MKKYEFTGKTQAVEFEGKEYVVNQIRALIEIPEHSVRPGDLGGWIEDERSLSHVGKCWVDNGNAVYLDTRIQGDVWVCSEISFMKDDTESILGHVRNHTTIGGSGHIQDCVIDVSTIDGVKVELVDVSIDNSTLTGEIYGYKGLLKRVHVKQNGKHRISFDDCVFVQEVGAMDIENTDGKKLDLKNFRVDFPEKESVREIKGYGIISDVYGDVDSILISGEIEIKHVWFKTLSSLLSNASSQFTTVTGVLEDSIVIEDAEIILFNSKIVGETISLKGYMNLKNSSVSDYSSIYNASNHAFDMFQVTMKDCSRIEIAKGTANKFSSKKVANLTLKDDNHLVL